MPMQPKLYDIWRKKNKQKSSIEKEERKIRKKYITFENFSKLYNIIYKVIDKYKPISINANILKLYKYETKIVLYESKPSVQLNMYEV